MLYSCACSIGACGCSGKGGIKPCDARLGKPLLSRQTVLQDGQSGGVGAQKCTVPLVPGQISHHIIFYGNSIPPRCGLKHKSSQECFACASTSCQIKRRIYPLHKWRVCAMSSSQFLAGGTQSLPHKYSLITPAKPHLLDLG